MIRFEQGNKVKVERRLKNGEKETVKGTVDSVPEDGLWVSWEGVDFQWAHQNLYVPHESTLYSKIELDESE